MTLGKTFRIAIIGGGPAGLAMGIALKRKGFDNLVIFEREKNDGVRHQGWSISLFSPVGGLALLDHLNLASEFSDISFEPIFRALDGETGKTLLHTAGSGGNGRRFKRGDLRTALFQVCQREGVEVIWDARVKSFEETEDKVHVHFADETKHLMEIADLLIGADGLHSPIRKQLTGDEIRPAGFNAVVGLIKKESDGSNDDLFEHELIKSTGALVSGRNVACWYAHQVLHNEIYWSLSMQCSEDYIEQRTNYDKKKLHDLALELSQNFFPLIQQMVQRTPAEQMQDSLLFKDLDPLKQQPSGRYCVSRTGRVTLIGDAAHAMLPFRGQGGNTAFMDVWNLSDHLGTLVDQSEATNDQIEEILSRYENERMPIGSYELLESRQNAARFHSPSSITIFFRNNIMRLVHLKNQFDNWFNKQS